VIPASLGGTWIDARVCRSCNARANEVADRLISHDFLVRFLRAQYEVPDRYGKAPPPPVITARLSSGGVMKATLHPDGPSFSAGVPPAVAQALDLVGGDQERLRQVFASAAGASDAAASQESLDVARLAQQRATPPEAWSRFMAKLGLACGREAYGDGWLDSRQARVLSRDLLDDRPPRFAQRSHHPPVEPSWPYEPPKHRLWIQPHQDTAVLMIALFGQVLGAVPINDLPAEATISAWSLDPQTGEYYRSTYHAMWAATVARRANVAGGTPLMIETEEGPLVYIPDGPDGPIDMGAEMARVQSSAEVVEWVERRRRRTSQPQ
jgi:hypothetical protein